MILVGSLKMNEPATAVNALHCYDDNMWIEVGIYGSLFTGCHQILILMMINMSQMVLIRVPNNMGLFAPPDALQRIGSSIRAKLLENVIDRELEKCETQESEPGKEKRKPSKLALVLRELRRRNLEATQEKEDRL